MSIAKVLSRIENLPAPVPGEVRPPPPEIIAFFVHTQRRMRRLKQSALASMAGISLSTMERVERGESVDMASLEKLENALGLEKGYISAPRAPLSQEELVAQFERSAKVELVEVRPLKSQAQVRKLAECHGYLPLANVPHQECPDNIKGLLEWIDLAAFIRGDIASRVPGEKISFRDLYENILSHVKGMEREGYNVLAGSLNFPLEDCSEWQVAVLYVSTRASDPGGQKRQLVPVDTSHFKGKLTLADCHWWRDDE